MRLTSENIEIRKQRLIEALRFLNDEKKISQIEYLVLAKDTTNDRTAALTKLAGAWSEEDADEIKKIIASGCENVDESGW